MSKRSVAWRKRFNQAIGNDLEQDGTRELRRVFIRDDDQAIGLIIPRYAKGKKSEKPCTQDMTSQNVERIRALLQAEGKRAHR